MEQTSVEFYQKVFEASIEANLGELEAVLACEEDCEGWFSWHSCDVCNEGLGGERHPVVFFDKEGNRVSEGACCSACLCYLANGDLPETYFSLADVICDCCAAILDIRTFRDIKCPECGEE